MKKFLRDKYSTLLLIVGLVLAFFVAVNVIAMMNEIQNEQQKKVNHAYKNTYLIQAEAGGLKSETYVNNMDKLMEELQVEKGNLFWYGYFSFIGDGLKNPTMYTTLCANEPYPEYYISGSASDSIDETIPEAMVGSCLKQYVYEIDGKPYITIDTIEYQVSGIYETYGDNEMGDDMELCIDYRCLNEKTKMAIKYNFADCGLCYVYSSNMMTEKEMEETIKSFETVFKDYGYFLTYTKVENTLQGASNIVEKVKRKVNFVFMGVVLAFTLINCMVVSNIWIKRRYQEIIIRRTYGYSVLDMLICLVRDLLKYVVCAVVLAIVLQTIYAGILQKEQLQLQYMGVNLIYLLGMVLLVTLANLVVPMYQIKRIVPAQNIRKQKR